MKIVKMIALVLVIIGGLNWALAIFDFNLVSAILGTGILSKIVYGLVGVSALISLSIFKDISES